MEIVADDGGQIAPPSVTAKKRGKTKAGANWKRDGDVAVIALEIDLSADVAMRKRFENQWRAAYQLERAIKTDARSRVAAYDQWRSGRKYQKLSKTDRAAACKDKQAELRLSAVDFTYDAYKHMDNSKWLGNHLTKAQGCHHAAAVWQNTSRHLFPDSTGKYFGAPKVGSWWDFTRMVGRARSHTKKQPTWETFRLVGSLDGHFQAFATSAVTGLNIEKLRGWAKTHRGISLMAQPHRMPIPARPLPDRPLAKGSWWFYEARLRWL